MSEEKDSPQPPPPEQPTLLGNLAPDEMFARGMQSVKMTSGAQGTWQPPSVEEANRLFPNYTVISLLGRGGMGAVYRAKQTALDRLVAIKLLPLEISVDKDFADRFVREARAMAKLNHPNIITVYDFGTTSEGHLYFVMEYVEGANLADIIHQVGLGPAQALAIVEQVCTALAYAHNKGIVHRDIKPANVMIDTESQVKVADFGLARLTDPSAEQMGHTMTGTVMGTPDYMAPEQMQGMNVDHRADIYSLGVMVYEMLCREVPRGAFEPPSVRGGCDPRIDPIVIKAMQPNPERRYQSTQEMKTDVSAVRQPAPVRTSVPAPRPFLPPHHLNPPPRKSHPRCRPPHRKPRSCRRSSRRLRRANPKRRSTRESPSPSWRSSRSSRSSCPSSSLGTHLALEAPLPRPPTKRELRRQVRPQAGAWARARARTEGHAPACPHRLRVARAPGAATFRRRVLLLKKRRRLRAKIPATATEALEAPLTATKDAPFVNTLGMKFVPVPILGGPTGGQRVLFSVWDTRVQDYAEFVKETKREWKKPDFEQGHIPEGECELGGCAALLPMVDEEGAGRGAAAGGIQLPAAERSRVELRGGNWSEGGGNQTAEGKGPKNY